jgi:hypothetical protein
MITLYLVGFLGPKNPPSVSGRKDKICGTYLTFGIVYD